MSNTSDEVGFDPLRDSGETRRQTGGRTREPHTRCINRGIFPQPDRIIAGRNYWFQSTITAWLSNNKPGDAPQTADEAAVKVADEATADAEDEEAAEDEARRREDGEAEVAEADAPAAA